MQLEPEVIDELEQGRLISAIKVLRKKRSIGLKDAKIVVNEYLKENPHLDSKTKIKTSTPLFILTIVFIVYTLYRILFLK